jgi:SAM-dependent methyltransferase
MNNDTPITRFARLHNHTRETSNFAEKFRALGRFDLLLLLKILETSDLAREGIANSGSYRFADHIYRNEASGTGSFGKILDRVLLSLPSASTMRRRYIKARECMIAMALSPHVDQIEILTVPCGMPRDVAEMIQRIQIESPSRAAAIRYTGFDLDPAVLADAKKSLPANAELIAADALDPSAFPTDQFHHISSTGLGEFLSDENLQLFYRNIHKSLRPGGLFFTSAIRSDPISQRLMRNFELTYSNRTESHLYPILSRLEWHQLRFEEDPSGLQTYVYGTK